MQEEIVTARWGWAASWSVALAVVAVGVALGSASFTVALVSAVMMIGLMATDTQWRSVEGFVLSAAAVGAAVQVALSLAWQVFPLLTLVFGLVYVRANRRVGVSSRDFFLGRYVFRPRLARGLVGLSQVGVALLVCSGSALAIAVYIHASGILAFVPPNGRGSSLLLGLALLNALTEEVVWRGMALAACLRVGFGPVASVGLQALSFGLAHYGSGFPGGVIGVCLTVTFGLALGLLRFWTRSLLLPVLSHWFVDFYIAWSITHPTS